MRDYDIAAAYAVEGLQPNGTTDPHAQAVTANIPGIKARHAIVTPNCRIVQGGNIEAFEVAVGVLKKEYEACMALECNELANFHLVLTIDREKGVLF